MSSCKKKNQRQGREREVYREKKEEERPFVTPWEI
jgi:hypothetical protein